MAYYSRRHYRSVSPAADTQAAIDARFQHTEARALMEAERATQCPVLTPETFDAVCQWQTARIAFHQASLAADPTWTRSRT